jgi:hypothetical protein
VFVLGGLGVVDLLEFVEMGLYFGEFVFGEGLTQELLDVF